MNARDILLDEARNHNNWKRTCKKKYDIWMCMPGPGKNVTNFLEGSHYVTNENKPFVLSVGQWMLRNCLRLIDYLEVSL